ncbi:hypothetical protein D9619_009025 [Psilocybe cf. subviscida]|uniref:Nephrocystin 3-like N-terminal domain-containing protein n=1 Tax=Psilocybe cf. subviscida TaxID=2480587 RepID=A0A8H5BWC7_9AGAR|nr:hypothetical protein D9619_009025 [Psilocybe cf. subviscida]
MSLSRSAMSISTTLMQSRRILITGGSFTQTYTAVNLEHTALGAMHDSSERYPPPRCQDGQYCEQLELAMKWVEEPTHDLSIHWVIAPSESAGPRSTAIAQTLAEKLATEGRLAGSFFFEQGKAKRDTSQYFFSTLAYQIAINVPGMRELINAVMVSDPTLPTKVYRRPAEGLNRRALPRLDQRDILKLLKHQTLALVPLRFLVFDQQDTQLVDFFSRQHCFTLHLGREGDSKQKAPYSETPSPSLGQDAGCIGVEHASTETPFDGAKDSYRIGAPQPLSAADLDSFNELSAIMRKEIWGGRKTIVTEDLTPWFDRETEITVGDYNRWTNIPCLHHQENRNPLYPLDDWHKDPMKSALNPQGDLPQVDMSSPSDWSDTHFQVEDVLSPALGRGQDWMQDPLFHHDTLTNSELEFCDVFSSFCIVRDGSPMSIDLLESGVDSCPSLARSS